MGYPSIPGYRVIKRLGEGGMATVYLAIQENFQREIALKIMSSRLLADESFGGRFLREARIVAQLSHRNIVPVYDVGRHDDYHYIAMELLAGGDLKGRLAEGVGLENSIGIVRQVAIALDYASSKGFIHRDIKPDNILFREDGSAVVSDFGIARSTESNTHMTQTGMIIGTPSYMSPEQAQGKVLDVRSDLYSLGVILFEMLTGNLPYTADSPLSVGIKHITEAIPLLPDDYADFQVLIDQALAKDPDDRFESGQSLIAALDELEGRLKSGDGSTVLLKAGELKRRARAVRKSAATDARLPTSATTRATRSRTANSVRYESPGQQRNTKSIIALSVAGAILAGGTGYWFYDPKPSQPSAEFGDAINTKELQAIALLIENGQAALSDERWYQPKENNAQFYFTTALALAPENDEALQGLKDLLKSYLDRSKAELGAGNSNSASEWLTRSTQIAFYTNDQSLLTLQQQLRADIFQFQQQQIRQQEKRQRIAGLIQSANQALAEDRLIPPAENDAYSNFLLVLSLDPENKMASAGIRSTAGSFLNQAQSVATEKNYAEARRLLAHAVQIDAQHPDLVMTQQRIMGLEQQDQQQALILSQQEANEASERLAEQQREEQEATQRKIQQRLLEADQLLAQDLLQSSTDENAAQAYRDVLIIDPANEPAQKGLEAIGARYVEFAEQALTKGDIDSADTQLSLAQQFVPDSQALVALRKSVIEQREVIAQADDVEKLKAQDISALLDKARSDISRNRLFSPKGNNALEKLTRALSLEPGNATATTLMESAAQKLATQAGSAIQKGDFSTAKRVIKILNQYLPNYTATKQLGEQLAQEEQSRNELKSQLDNLLDQSRRLEGVARTTENNEAIRELYRKVLVLDEQNKVASAGMDRAHAFNSAQAKAALDTNELAAAEVQLALLEKWAPRHASVPGLASTLQVKQRDKAQFEQLLSDAAALYSNINWIESKGKELQQLEAAFQSISKAEQLMPQNSLVEASMTNLEASYISGTQAYTGAELFDNAQALHEQAKLLGVSSASLDASRSQMESKLQAFNKKAIEKKKKLTRSRGIF